ncbi:MAG TPA: hypothetical protein VH479_06880 [Acidimicrobiales bacterium]|jgi:hypothetical protein
MAVMAVCGALLVAGLLGLVWCGRDFRVPPVEDRPGAARVAQRFVWYCGLGITGAFVAGITVIGAGGRLAMRLLAVTAGDGAQGRITEADQVVGDITLAGTRDFILFTGIFGGLIAAAIYLVARRYLPPNPLGGLVFGAGLLVVLGTVIDPLRAENPDFDIVGPGWLSVAVFGLLALVFGPVLAGWMARLSEWLPLPSAEPRVLVRYAVPAVPALVVFPVLAPLLVLGVVVVLVTRWGALVDAVRSHRALLVGRVALVALVVLALPGALAAMSDIVGR